MDRLILINRSKAGVPEEYQIIDLDHEILSEDARRLVDSNIRKESSWKCFGQGFPDKTHPSSTQKLRISPFYSDT